MAGRKRSAKNKKRAKARDRDSERQEPKRGEELVDKIVLRSGYLHGVRPSEFQEAGYACPGCDFRTLKRGDAGKQAMRAHSKRHVRDRRARRRQGYGLLVLLAVALAVAFAPAIAGFALLDGIDTGSVMGWSRVDIGGIALLVLSLLLVAALLISASQMLKTGRRGWSRKYSASLWATAFLVLAAAVSRWTVIETIHWPWLFSVLLPWSAALLTGSEVGMARLQVRRREFNPGNRLTLFRAVRIDTDSRIRMAIRNLRTAIMDGRFDPSILPREQLGVLWRMGLKGVYPDPVFIKRRLVSRQHSRQREIHRREAERRRAEREKEREQREWDAIKRSWEER